MASRKKDSRGPNPFERRKRGAERRPDRDVHVFGNNVVCDTDTRGYETPRRRSLLELVVDSSEGFIPLWARDITLRWRFNESSMKVFSKPNAAKTAIRKLFGSALVAWGDASPVRFAERNDAWDFEVVMREADKCSAVGCVLASAFFPDGGRHELVLYPKLFDQPRHEQIETMAHEVGHIFGLRHFFATVRETAFPAEIFGTHKRFTIMNYGPDSRLTSDDRRDLKRLYTAAWKGELTQINGTPIRLMKPFHAAAESAADNVFGFGAPPAPQPIAAFLVDPGEAGTPPVPRPSP